MLALRRPERCHSLGCECRTIPYANLGLGHHLDCANFCAHPTDRWAQLRTASHMLRPLLSCFFSAVTLKTGWLFLVVRLPWAQEAWSSNLHAPTNIFGDNDLQNDNFGTAALWCNLGTMRKTSPKDRMRTSCKQLETWRGRAGRLCPE